MIAQNKDDQPDPVGDIGGLRPGIYDTRLIERALRERWPIPDKYREPIINRQVRIAMDPSSSNRESTSAARCLVSMEQQNADIALKMLDKLVPDQHEHQHHAAELQDALAKAREDEQYVSMERRRALTNGSQPGTNGHNGHGGPLDHGPASRAG